MRVERAFGRCVAEMRSSAVAAAPAPPPVLGGFLLRFGKFSGKFITSSVQHS